MTAPVFRPVSPEDEGLLFRLYASTRAAELAMVPWAEQQKQAFLQMQFAGQQQHYPAHYPQGEHLIILSQKVPVGRLYVNRTSERIHIIDVTILPEYRGTGIGTAILQGLLDEGAATGRSVTIYVESFNPSLRLFERLGFAQVSQDGFIRLLQWSNQRGRSEREK